MSDDEQDSDSQWRNQMALNAYVLSRLKPVEAAYQQGITSLWLGNGTASIAVLSFIGAAWHDGHFPKELLWPLTCFVSGLIVMGMGTGTYLFTEGKFIRLIEDRDSILDTPVGSAKSPAQKAGLTLRDSRTVMAFPAAVLFAVGCTIGLFELWSAS
ncbi:MAG: hypothetical protein ABSC92_18770 [Rhizomicrobium sp.]|jgi:hypothetical protein